MSMYVHSTIYVSLEYTSRQRHGSQNPKHKINNLGFMKHWFEYS